MNGYTKREADIARAEGETVHGCWWCLNEMNPKATNNRPYWKAEDLTDIGHRMACPNHKDQNQRRLP